MSNRNAQQFFQLLRAAMRAGDRLAVAHQLLELLFASLTPELEDGHLVLQKIDATVLFDSSPPAEQ